MAKPIPTIPSIRTILELVEGYWPNLDSWLSRPLPRAHVVALSPEAKKARKRAQIRICKANKRRPSQPHSRLRCYLESTPAE